jgi:hypothetical protein
VKENEHCRRKILRAVLYRTDICTPCAEGRPTPHCCQHFLLYMMEAKCTRHSVDSSSTQERPTCEDSESLLAFKSCESFYVTVSHVKVVLLGPHWALEWFHLMWLRSWVQLLMLIEAKGAPMSWALIICPITMISHIYLFLAQSNMVRFVTFSSFTPKDSFPFIVLSYESQQAAHDRVWPIRRQHVLSSSNTLMSYDYE